MSMDTKGGLPTFAASANRSSCSVESRHPHLLETEMFAALPQGGSEPILPNAAYCTNVRYHERAKNLQQQLRF